MLSQRGADIEERDFFKDPFSEAEVRGLSRGRALSDIFSWRSPSFKALGLSKDEAGRLGDDDLVRLMLQEPRLIRRPMVRVGEELIIGSNAKELERALGAL